MEWYRNELQDAKSRDTTQRALEPFTIDILSCIFSCHIYLQLRSEIHLKKPHQGHLSYTDVVEQTSGEY